MRTIRGMRAARTLFAARSCFPHNFPLTWQIRTPKRRKAAIQRPVRPNLMLDLGRSLSFPISAHRARNKFGVGVGSGTYSGEGPPDNNFIQRWYPDNSTSVYSCYLLLLLYPRKRYYRLWAIIGAGPVKIDFTAAIELTRECSTANRTEPHDGIY